jgi:hypothetical protein
MSVVPDPGAFGAAFEQFMEAMSLLAERRQSEVTRRLIEHIGADPAELPTTGVEFAVTDHANLQLALNAVIPDAELVGFTTRHAGFGAVGLAEILAGEAMGAPVRAGPVRYVDIEVGDGRVIQCVESALLLVRRDRTPVALVLSRGTDHPMRAPGLRLEGVSREPGAVSELVRELRAAMRQHNVFRGQIISLHRREERGAVEVQFHAVPAVRRDSVILPPGALERLERHTIGITKSAGRLRAAGKHLKRGVLLHGPPGTGKTLSTMYLLHAMTGRTTILLTGRGLSLIEQALEIGRELAPATFVFEDIDLVAAERTMEFASQGVLFELLNQMEGLAEDEDLLFVLTTNRPDVIEPALAARPGRVDLALEIPLPGIEQRRRLFELYGGGIEIDPDSLDQLVDRSDRVSGAFIKEVIRQAWLQAALEDRDPPTAQDLRHVMDDLLDERSTMTRRLLGQHSDDSPLAEPVPAMQRALTATGLPLPG